MNAAEKLIAEYRERIAAFDRLIECEQEFSRTSRAQGIPFSERSLRCAEARRLNDLRQICVQVVKDIEALADELAQAGG